MGLFDGVPFLVETPQQISARWEQGQQRLQQNLQFLVKQEVDQRQFNELLKLRQQAQQSDQAFKELQAKSMIINQMAQQQDMAFKQREYNAELDAVPFMTDYKNAGFAADTPSAIPLAPAGLPPRAAKQADAWASERRMQLATEASIKVNRDRVTAYVEKQNNLNSRVNDLSVSQRAYFSQLMEGFDRANPVDRYGFETDEEKQLRLDKRQAYAEEAFRMAANLQPAIGGGPITLSGPGFQQQGTNAPAAQVPAAQQGGPSFQNLLKAKGIK